MAYREVGMVEIKEVLLLWLAGKNNTEVAAGAGVDRKTVRTYVREARALGLRQDGGAAGLTDELLVKLVAVLRPPTGRPHGGGWDTCEQHRARIEKHLADNVKLTKVRKLLARAGIDVTYSTLHRFAVEELGFGGTSATVPIAEGEPGSEIQVDTGWVLYLETPGGPRKRLRAWIFTPTVSRYRFVWPCLQETTESAIAACEAAWEFYGGVFKVLMPDNTKAIVIEPDALKPRFTQAFLEYAQARGFHIDPARVRKPKDKARVERSVRIVRDDCFAGEHLATLDQAVEHARNWCSNEYGMQRHARTQRLPREHFLAEEQPALLQAPVGRYDTPLWCSPKVPRDHLAQVARALYSLPTHLIGKTLRARADSQTVRFYEKPDSVDPVKIHPRKPPGGRSVDPADFPAEKTAYAMRDVAFLEKEAFKHGEHVGRFAKGLLDSPLPWTRMRSVYALLGLCKRYGDDRVERECTIAVEVDLYDVYRLERMIKLAAPKTTAPASSKVIPIARYLRPAAQYALPLAPPNTDDNHGGES